MHYIFFKRKAYHCLYVLFCYICHIYKLILNLPNYYNYIILKLIATQFHQYSIKSQLYSLTNSAFPTQDYSVRIQLLSQLTVNPVLDQLTPQLYTTLAVSVGDQDPAVLAVTVITCLPMCSMTAVESAGGMTLPVWAVIWCHSYTH